jgi:hypothetical protein
MATPTRRTRLTKSRHWVNYPSWPRPRSHWIGVLLVLGTNNWTNWTKTPNTQLKTAQPGVCATPVRPMIPIRPVDFTGQVSDTQRMHNEVLGIISDFSRPWNKNHLQNSNCWGRKTFTNPSQTLQNLPRTDQQHLSYKTHKPGSSPEENPTRALHRLDWSSLGNSGWTTTPGSTPPNPNLDLPIRSTDLYNTLGIVGTTHGHSIANIGPPKLS